MKSFEHMFPGEDMRTVAKIVECPYGASSRSTQFSGSSGVSDAGWRLDYGSSISHLGRLGGERDDTFASESYGSGEKFYGETSDYGVSYSDSSPFFQDAEEDFSSCYGYICEESEELEFQFSRADEKTFFERKDLNLPVELKRDFENSNLVNLRAIVEEFKFGQIQEDNLDAEKLKILERLIELVTEARNELRTDIEGFGNLDLFLGRILVSDERKIDFQLAKAFVEAHDSED
ncbi:hypothetical protein MHSWG343_01290 [Candidatus Mycoplasma haematohominis]|uniref:Uncharacterized protein n=1 Tax=Candidatus Mycoplasma haematohominis TaxID=1494318 RepID=A0A478FP97_9MOLU|nr:hypothetical protein MHSWG343_01290 [Candidatus Mycoplasma haemohominis]